MSKIRERKMPLCGQVAVVMAKAQDVGLGIAQEFAGHSATITVAAHDHPTTSDGIHR